MAFEVATATVTIVPTMKGAQEKIQEGLGAEKAGKQAGEKTGSGLVGTLKKVVAAAAIGDFVKTSLSAGADLQQSFGGLDTIYGDSADAMKQYAQQAYQMGLSANDYAETAVGMGAALKAAFGGDTEKAMEAANTAIGDMTDNAAKMGTPIESIQNAYAGFAKGQFNMLDNLKLGYGGTKSEMERLLADAQKISGVEYNIDNLGDVYDAIHVIQGELGLTGVAAEEGATTFSGSFASMQAAATNFLAALTLGDGVDTAFRQMVSSAETFLIGNLLPMVSNMLQQLPGLLAQIPGYLAELIPQLIPMAGELIAGLVTGLVEGIPTFMSGLGTLFESAWDAVQNIDWAAVGQFCVDTLVSAWNGLIEGAGSIWESVKTVFGEALETVPILSDAWDAIVTTAESLWTTVTGVFTGEISVVDILTGAWDAITGIAESLWNQVVAFFTGGISTEAIDSAAWDAITGIADGLWATVTTTFKTAISVVGIITDAWDGIVDIATGFFNDVVGVFTGEVSVSEIATSAWDTLTGVAETYWNAAKAIFETVGPAAASVVTTAWDTLKGTAKSVWSAAKSVFTGAGPKVKSVVTTAWVSLASTAEGVWDAAKSVFETTAPAVKEVATKAWDTLSATASTVWDGVKAVFEGFEIEWPDFGELASSAFEGLKSAAKGAWDWVKGLFGGGKDDETVQAVEGSTAEMEAALAQCNLVVSDVDTSSIDTANSYVTETANSWATTISGISLVVPYVNTSSLSTAIAAVQGAAQSMRNAMNFSWSIPTPHGSLPTISVSMRSASSSDGKTTVSYPEFSVGTRWYAQGGIFKQPTVIGVGEAGAEAALPLDQFWRRLDTEFANSGSGAVINNYIEINGATDPVTYADELARELQQQLKRS